MNDTEKARNSIMKHLTEINCDDVLRSIIFVMGDYVVCEDGEERAGYITAILRNIVSCGKTENLCKIYSVARTLAEIEADKAV